MLSLFTHRQAETQKTELLAKKGQKKLMASLGKDFRSAKSKSSSLAKTSTSL